MSARPVCSIERDALKRDFCLIALKGFVDIRPSSRPYSYKLLQTEKTWEMLPRDGWYGTPATGQSRSAALPMRFADLTVNGCQRGFGHSSKYLSDATIRNLLRVTGPRQPMGGFMQNSKKASASARRSSIRGFFRINNAQSSRRSAWVRYETNVASTLEYERRNPRTASKPSTGFRCASKFAR
ncbi:hypothetical protein D3C85_1371930 [compost metagenome]